MHVVRELHPPYKFGHVNDGILRSRYPTASALPFLSQRGVKTVVFLSPEVPSKSFVVAARNSGMTMELVGIQTYTTAVEWRVVSPECTKRALSIAADPDRQPVLLCCATGVHVTGAVVACLRKKQGWNTVALLNEYRSYASGKPRDFVERFIHTFDPDILALPMWQHAACPLDSSTDTDTPPQYRQYELVSSRDQYTKKILVEEGDD